MATGQLTEDFLLTRTGAERLDSITSLDLHGLGLKHLDPILFQRLSRLEVLDVSENHLREIPNNIGLPLLRKLDCDDNQLNSLGFVKQFPQLEELYVEGNGLESSERFIVGALCPKIKNVNKTPGLTLRKMFENVRCRTLPHVEEAWDEIFAAKFPDGIPMEDLQVVKQQLADEVMKIAAITTQNRLRKFVVHFTCDQLVDDIQLGVCGTPAKTPRLSSTPAKTPRLSPSPAKTPRLSSSPAKTPRLSSTRAKTPRLSSSPAKTPRLSSSPAKTPRLSSSPAKTPRLSSSPAKTPRLSSSPTKTPRLSLSPQEPPVFQTLGNRSAKLSSVCDYEPVHFMRCHFGDKEAKKEKMKDNDPGDDVTKVWHAAFEPDPTNNEKTTSTVATCGGDTVCLIDCDTGHVMKRFKQQKEQFFFVAWTTMTLENESGREYPSNILAVGGFNAHIRLLLPEQLVCYSEMGNGRPNRAVQCYFISALLFHPEEPTWLFSGTSDATVTLWDIGIPRGQKYESECSQLLILHSPGEGILCMVFSRSTGHLVAGCEEGCYTWKISETKTFKKHRDPTMTLVLPGDKDKMVDGLTMVSDKYVASKAAHEGCIVVWSLSSTLAGHRRSSKTAVSIQPLIVLDWSNTDVEFIIPGARNGLLACGDDLGRIWLYNIERYLTTKKAPETQQPLKPSRLLEWPECLIDRGSNLDLKMTDVLDRVTELVVNSVCISGDKKYIVAGTDNNLVCIWKRSE